ncbi:MAG: hypothetical protein EOR52_14980 [Mesorhizobium sp.]|uniref:hypothetical protein n=1 Tax=Mesorhizobium sp. TaxID=1871066 RepID=UPI000FE8D79A|nr:hypothetical protein [Mesorhizobium sp.]RWK87956.1 MAG: hypothetical protein EOR52_14980 [Mesorhizobium sp.]
MSGAEQLERALRKLTAPINGQYPRPWMTASATPWASSVFTVGRNQRNGFAADLVGDHDTYLDALFNRNGQSCRGLYDRIIGKPSPTRINTDRLVAGLRDKGISDVIETNVICYSTPMSADLSLSEHHGGAQRGSEVFRAIFEFIKPRVMVVHGAGTSKELGRLLGIQLPPVPATPERTTRTRTPTTEIWIIPSLAPPKWNSWARWASRHMDLVCKEVGEYVSA